MFGCLGKGQERNGKVMMINFTVKITTDIKQNFHDNLP